MSRLLHQSLPRVENRSTMKWQLMSHRNNVTYLIRLHFSIFPCRWCRLFWTSPFKHSWLAILPQRTNILSLSKYSFKRMRIIHRTNASTLGCLQDYPSWINVILCSKKRNFALVPFPRLAMIALLSHLPRLRKRMYTQTCLTERHGPLLQIITKIVNNVLNFICP